MIFCGFDTETTGLVLRDKLPSHPDQPDLVQLCAKLFDEERIYATLDLLVIPEKEIHPKAQEVHGISKELCLQFGVPRRVAVACFNNFIKKADVYICHNVSFDSRALLTAYHRENVLAEELQNTPGYCTMIESTPILKLPNPKFPSGYKWPSLDEAYRFFVDPEGFEGAHDAQVDVDAMIKVFWAMRKQNGGSDDPRFRQK